MAEPITTATAAASGKAAWEFIEALWGTFKSRELLDQVLRSIGRKYSVGDGKILVFGQAGCGKSRLGQMLNHENKRVSGRPASDLPTGYEQSYKTERAKFERQLFSIYEGQPSSFRKKQEQIAEDLAADKYVGAIHVVSFGYTVMSSAIEETAEYKSAAGNLEEAKRLFLRERRRADIQYLAEMKDALKFAQEYEFRWLLTLITKQDLWHAEQAAALDFYRPESDSNVTGEVVSYGDHVKDIARHRGVSFAHDICSLAIQAEHIRDAGNRKVFTTSFDRDDVESSWKGFFDSLQKLAPP